MNGIDQYEVDLSLASELAGWAATVVGRTRDTDDLMETVAHLIGAIGLLLIAGTKPGMSTACVPGLARALECILSKIEDIDAARTN